MTGERSVTSCFIWAQLDLMFKKRPEAETEEYCHYSNGADALSGEGVGGNKGSEDRQTFTHRHAHLTDKAATESRRGK